MAFDVKIHVANFQVDQSMPTFAKMRSKFKDFGVLGKNSYTLENVHSSVHLEKKNKH